MDLDSAGLTQQPFPTHGKPTSIITYGSERAAIEMLRETCEHPTGLSLLQGPALSGKSTIIRTFVRIVPDDCSLALIDGKGLNTTNLLVSLLRQFGYEPDLSSAKELLGLVRVFAQQQTVSQQAPLLIIENAHELNPSALRTVCELADLRVRNNCALKLVLVGDRAFSRIMATEAMESISKRLLHDFHLRPMTKPETTDYLLTKLRAAGKEQPESIFPQDICDALWAASGGWPGIVDRLSLLAISKAASLPVGLHDIEYPAIPAGTWGEPEEDVGPFTDKDEEKPPLLIVTNQGSVLTELAMEKSRLLFGRSEHNDVSINSRFISRHHLLLVKHGAATFLMDLNSTNGTFVNSKQVINHVLIHEDVITIGHHRIKFYDPYATKRDALTGDAFSETMIMKTLEDMRNLLAKESTSELPSATENLPTIQT